MLEQQDGGLGHYHKMSRNPHDTLASRRVQLFGVPVGVPKVYWLRLGLTRTVRFVGV